MAKWSSEERSNSIQMTLRPRRRLSRCRTCTLRMAKPQTAEGTDATQCQAAHSASDLGVIMKRYGSVLKIRPEAIESYKAYHPNVWTEILATIRRGHLRNSSLYLKDTFLLPYTEHPL